MKLRIVDQEVRFRLTADDLAAFGESGVLELPIQLGPELDQKLVFGLIRSDEHEEMSVIYEKGHVAILVPASQLNALQASHSSELIHSLALNDSISLTVRVELDRECAHQDASST